MAAESPPIAARIVDEYARAFPDEQAALIRQMIVGIDAISDSETHVAIQDFLHLDDSHAQCQRRADVCFLRRCARL